MATLELILLLLAAVLASAVISQFTPRVSAPLIQIVLGICIEVFTADTVSVTYGADLFLVLFIAPLLYDEARNANKSALLRNLKPVLGLAVGLVLVTMFTVGAAVNWLVPAIPFAAACMLGAALGPTDAVAVGSLPKDVNIGERRRHILQGEYLLNDASGIIGFQFALAVITTGAFSIWQASLNFIISFFGGLLVGLVVGWAANQVEKLIRRAGVENTTFHVLFDIFMPFIIYLMAEPFGASGIIAVVVGGLMRSFANKGSDPITSRLAIVSSSVWQTISFALNGIVFVLLGTQLPRAMTYTINNPAVSLGDLALWVVIITAILLGTRFLWLYVEEFVHARAKGRSFFSAETLQSALIMTIAGPKGAVTLSIIFTIPVLASESAFFPERSLIIFLATGVILLTLLLSNFALPLFTPKEELKQEELNRRQQDKDTEIAILRRVVEVLSANQTEETAHATAEVVARYNARIARVQAEAADAADAPAAAGATATAAGEKAVDPLTAMYLEVFDWERAMIVEAIGKGEAAPLLGYRYLNRLDRRTNALLHRTAKINPKNILREAKEMYKRFVRRTKSLMAGNDFVDTETEELQDLQMRVFAGCIKRLRSELSADTFPTEAVSTLLFEYQAGLRRLHASTTANTTGAHKLAVIEAELEQAGITLELEGIHNAYEAGTLSRQAAKRMRDNVTFMQVNMKAGE